MLCDRTYALSADRPFEWLFDMFEIEIEIEMAEWKWEDGLRLAKAWE